MGFLLFGTLLAVGSAQVEPPATEQRLPFETGQIRVVTALGEYRACSVSGRGAGYQAIAESLCETGSPEPPPGNRHTLLISFTRAGESQVAPAPAPGRRLYDLEAEVSLEPSGAFGVCRVIREQGTPRLYFYARGQACENLRRDRPLFAAATGSGLRHGRLRISIFVDAPPPAVAELLRPPPPVIVMPTPPPPIMAPPAPPAPPPPPAPPSMSRPQPINRNAWFTSDDYPAAALRAEEQGAVTVRLEVSALGRVSNCTITQSSGSAALDAAACRIFRSRARYRPARDARGQAIAGAIAERVRWELPEDDLLPREPAYAALSIGVDGGARTYCTPIEEVPAGNGLAWIGSGFIVPAGEAVPSAIAQGRPALRITLEIAREGMPRPEFIRQEGRTIFAAAAAFQVQADGSMADCRTSVIVAPGGESSPFDLCAVLRNVGMRPFPIRPEAVPEPVRLVLTVFEGGRR